MLFLCDEMVGRLGRWLRAAGYDTAMPAPGAADRDVVTLAVAENRVILTCDAALAEHRRAAGRVFSLSGDRLEGWVGQITPAFHIDWLARPFSRCLVCNGELGPHPAGRAVLPPGARDAAGPVMHCPRCDKPYWLGRHARRMRERLSRWRAAAATNAASGCSLPQKRMQGGGNA